MSTHLHATFYSCKMLDELPSSVKTATPSTVTGIHPVISFREKKNKDVAKESSDHGKDCSEPGRMEDFGRGAPWPGPVSNVRLTEEKQLGLWPRAQSC